MPLFSVIIPTKDRPQMLARALGSAMVQRGADFEIVVADDGDGSGAALAERTVRVPLKTIVTSKLGQVPARNMALEAASGRFVAFLDDDDWWEGEDYLQRLAQTLAQGGCLAYASGRIVREGLGASPGDWIAFDAHLDAESIRRDNTLLISGIAYPRAWHDIHCPFDEEFPHYWDWDWYLRLAAAGRRFTAASTDVVRISARADNVSSPANEAARAAELARLCTRHGLEGVVLKNHEIIALEQEARRRIW